VLLVAPGIPCPCKVDHAVPDARIDGVDRCPSAIAVSECCGALLLIGRMKSLSLAYRHPHQG
jgi:hypothetical protein